MSTAERSSIARKRLAASDVISAETWPTLAGPPVAVPAPTAGTLTHVQFRRFAGCPVCNLHLRSFAAQRDALEAAGIVEVIVFHSSPADLERYESDIPFTVVPDPKKVLYRRFGVEQGRRALLDPRVWRHIFVAVSRSAWRLARRGGSIPPLRPPGGRYGLPADFLIRDDGSILAARYGEHAYDQWSVEAVLDLASRTPDGGDR